MDEAKIVLRGDNAPLQASLAAGLVSVRAFAVNAARSLATVSAAIGVAAAFRLGAGALREFAEGESLQLRLGAAVKATGGAAGFSKDQLNDLANAVERLSNFEADAAVEAETLMLRFKNVRGDVFRDAIVAAADLATATGKDLPTAADKLGRALNDPLKGLRALRSEGIVFNASQQKTLETMVRAGDVMGAQRMILERLKETYGGTAEASTKGFGGAMADLMEQTRRAGESIGSILAPAIQSLAGIMGSVADFLTRSTPLWKALVENVGTFFGKFSAGGGLVSTFFTAFGQGVAGIGAAIETLYVHWDSLWEAMFNTVELGILTLYEEFKFFFTEQLPSLIKQGAEASRAFWTGDTVKPLQAPEREITEAEQVLRNRIQNSVSTIDKTFGDIFRGKLATWMDFFKPFTAPNITDIVPAPVEQPTDVSGPKKPGDAEKKSKSGVGDIVGLEEMWKRLQSASSKQKDPKEEFNELKKEVEEAGDDVEEAVMGVEANTAETNNLLRQLVARPSTATFA